MDTWNNNLLEEEDDNAVLAGCSSALRREKCQMFGLKKKDKTPFLMTFL